MRATTIVLCVSSLLACQAGFGDDGGAARIAWKRRSGEQGSVMYQAVIAASGNAATDATAMKEMRVEAWIHCEQRKYRFNTMGARERFPRVHILDSTRFRTCAQNLPGRWDVTEERSITAESSWLELYPFLLAHGVVPVPPFEVPQFPRDDGATNRDRKSVAGKRVTFRFESASPVIVVVGHAADELIDHYEVSQGGVKTLELRLSYRRDKGARTLEKFTVLRYANTGKLLQHLEGKVTGCKVDAKIPLTAFVPPRSRKAIHEQLIKAFDKPIPLKAEMSLEDLTESVQRVLGPDIRVTFDVEAVGRAPEVKADELSFEPGDEKLSDFLLRGLRANRLDFYVDSQGIVLIPRNRAWDYAESVQYGAKDYGLSVEELRDRIYASGRVDDWSDVGGRAMMLIGNNEPTIMVLHTQSDHFRFAEDLRKGNE